MIRESETRDSTISFVFLALAFYWGAALSIRFGLYSGGAFQTKAPEYNFIGSAGLLLALVAIGAFPKLLENKSTRRFLNVLPFLVGLVVGGCAIVSETVFSVPSLAWLVVRFLSAVGIGCILVQAGGALSLISRRKAALVAAASFGFGVLMSMGASSLPALPNALVSTLFIWVAAGSATGIYREADTVEQGIAAEDSLHPSVERSTGHVRISASMPSGFWAFFFGLAFYSIVYGMTLTLFPIMKFGDEFVLPVNQLLLVSGATMFLLLSARPHFNLRLFQWFLFVPIVIGLFPLPLIGAIGAVICCSLLIITFTFYDVTSIVLLSEMARNEQRPVAIRIFAWGRAANILGMGAGTLLVVPFIQDGVVIDRGKLVVLVFVAIFVMVAGMAYLGKSAFSATKKTSSDDSLGKWRRACETIGREFELSPRELEVFMYLAKGRSADYIAGKLFIAPSTVKTHTYRIYQKIDVHSQQDLMDVIEERSAFEANALDGKRRASAP